MASSHWIIVPLLLPLVTAALMLVLGEKRRVAKTWLNLASTFAGLVLALMLADAVHHHAAPGASGPDHGAGTVGIYLSANWAAPFGIVLVLDRLSAALLLLTGLLGFSAIVFAAARWDRIGVHFHPLFQIQLMGLNGAFLTGDLFNLFVFLEVLLSASYGLLLHAAGPGRVAAGLHYIAINLVASALFLLGAAMVYGTTGTLNMADLATRLPEVAAADRPLLRSGAAILAVAFLAKAAMWPLGFWLVPAYSAAGAPVAALFAIMTKVGVYAVLRIGSLMITDGGGASAGLAGTRFGSDWLVAGGLATLCFGTFGLLASRQLGRVAGFSLIVSSGILLAATGFGQPALTAAALYYLLVSTLAVGALFLLIELVDRSRLLETEHPNPDDADPVPFFVDETVPPRETNLDEFQQALVGRAIPAAVAFLGFAFIGCSLLITGMPPLSGFLGKFLMLTALLNPDGLGSGAIGPVGWSGWLLIAGVIGSGFAALIALSRTGIRMFWTPRDRPLPQLRIVECLPIAGILLLCTVATVRAEPVIRYLQAAAVELHDPGAYVSAVMRARPLPGPLSRPLPGPQSVTAPMPAPSR